MQINSFLVKKLQVSHQEIKAAIDMGQVCIDDVKATPKQMVNSTNTIMYKQKIIQEGKAFFYYAYNKPLGVESTLNVGIANNLVEASGIQDYFFPIGRLDKLSEGLMILTNDGNLYKEITDIKKAIAKIYRVEIDREITDEFIKNLAEGIVIMGTKTRPCRVDSIDRNHFQITLLEGRNRQIRRMCYKFNYEVLSLKRIAIGKLKLNDLSVGGIKQVSKNEILG